MVSHKVEKPPELAEVLALDGICLREVDGEPLDLAVHRERLLLSFPASKWAFVRREEQLVAYLYLWPLDEPDWFVGGLAIHPDHRRPSVLAALRRSVTLQLQALNIRRLKSHVLRGNQASLRLHRRLGFVVEQQNETALALSASCADILEYLPRGTAIGRSHSKLQQGNT